MNLRKYLIPEIVYGDNSLQLVSKYVKNFHGEKVLLVTDPGLIAAGWTYEVEECLEASGIPYTIFNNITANPKDYEVTEGAEIYRKEKCDLIVAIGGGSVIDCAKGIGIISTNAKNINDFEGVDNVQFPMPPLICIPTTAGSSADISQFAIIVNSSIKKKIAIISKSLVPDVSLIDPILTSTMSKELTAETGIDALVHAIEAYVSNASSLLTNINALKAITMITQNLGIVVKDPYNMRCRDLVMAGSMLAGMAFSNASLGLVHAMAHSLGGVTNLPHAECNALILKSCIEYNFDSCPEKFDDIYIAMGGQKTMNPDVLKPLLLKRVERILEECEITYSLNKYNFDGIDTNMLAEYAYNDPCIATNPKPINIEQIKCIYDSLISNH